MISLTETDVSALHWHETKEPPLPWVRPLPYCRCSAPAHSMQVSQITPHNASFPCCAG